MVIAQPSSCYESVGIVADNLVTHGEIPRPRFLSLLYAHSLGPELQNGTRRCQIRYVPA